MTMKKIAAILMILILTPSLTGCKGTKQEIETLVVVLATGFDLDSNNKYVVTVQTLNTQKNTSVSINTNNKFPQQIQSDVIVYSMEGETPRDAVSKLSTELGNNLFFGHSKYTVVGKSLAESGLGLYIDASLRSQDTRAHTPIFVTNGNASDIIGAVTNQNKIPANLVEQLTKLQVNFGYTPVITRLEFANALYSKKSAPVLGVINIDKNYSNNTFKLAGTGIFKKDKLIGFMDMYETRGMQWVNGKVKNGNVIIHFQDNKIVTLKILTAKNKIQPVLRNGKLIMKIKIKESANISEMTAPFDPMKNHKEMDTLNTLQNEIIEKEVRKALYICQKKYKSDVFNFNGVIKRELPEYWDKIENDWDKIYPNLQVEVLVDTSIKRPGLFSKSIG